MVKKKSTKKSSKKSTKGSSKKKSKGSSKKSKPKKVTKKTESSTTEEEVSMEMSLDEYQKELEELRNELNLENKEEKKDLGEYTFNEPADSVKETVEIDYNKLTDEEERRKIRKNMQISHLYLEKMGIQDLQVDSKKGMIIVPFEYEEFQFLSHILIGSEWFIVKASIMELKDIPAQITAEIFFELLKANFILNDVTYSVDPEGKSIWCEADIPSDTSFDHFKLQYLSIVFAIDYFIRNISTQNDTPIQSTYKPGSTSSDFYI